MRSMTGYARAEGLLEERRCTIEIKTVNHRFCDVNLKLPKALGSLEITIKKYLGARIERGRVDVIVQWENGGEGAIRVSLNASAAREYYNLLTVIKEQLGLSEEVNLSHVLSLRDVIFTVEKVEETFQNWDALKTLVDRALSDLESMRQAEGAALKQDFELRLQRLKELNEKVGNLAGRVPESIREKLINRFQQLELTPKIDESRLLSEVFFLSERADVVEETVRITSHLQQFHDLLSSTNSIGRKLDFILQELNREFNTIAAKSNDATISQAVVDAKSELEKMREQVQNVE